MLILNGALSCMGTLHSDPTKVREFSEIKSILYRLVLLLLKKDKGR